MLWLLLASAWADPFLRSVEEGDALGLEIASRTYTKGDKQVTLVGVAHLADASFYEAVDGVLTGKELVLFEGVGGEDRAEAEEAALTTMQRDLAHALGLSYQQEAIDYSRQGWKNSDLTVDALSAQMESKGADPDLVLDLVSGGRELKKMAKLTKRIEKSELVRAMTRLSLVETLPRSEQMMSAAMGDELYDWLVVARNDQVDKDIAAAEASSVGVLYGAGHLVELEERLLRQGYTVEAEQWLRAMTVKPEEEGLPPAIVSMTRKKISKKLDKLAN